VAARIPLPGARTSLSTTLTIPAARSGWYLLRARGESQVYPILDVYPYATTSPIYVTVGGKPIRSRSDAEYFLAWIARLEAGVLANDSWNTEAEKSQGVETIKRAREEFELRLGQ
jgi:TolB protein